MCEVINSQNTGPRLNFVWIDKNIECQLFKRQTIQYKIAIHEQVLYYSHGTPLHYCLV